MNVNSNYFYEIEKPLAIILFNLIICMLFTSIAFSGAKLTNTNIHVLQWRIVSAYKLYNFT